MKVLEAMDAARGRAPAKASDPRAKPVAVNEEVSIEGKAPRAWTARQTPEASTRARRLPRTAGVASRDNNATSRALAARDPPFHSARPPDESNADA